MQRQDKVGLVETMSCITTVDFPKLDIQSIDLSNLHQFLD